MNRPDTQIPAFVPRIATVRRAGLPLLTALGAAVLATSVACAPTDDVDEPTVIEGTPVGEKADDSDDAGSNGIEGGRAGNNVGGGGANGGGASAGGEESPPRGGSESAGGDEPPPRGGSESNPDAGRPPVEPDAAPPAPVGLAVLGAGTHDVANVNLELLANRSNGLRMPRDLAFNPRSEGELWVVNQTDDSTVTFFGLHTAEPELAKRIDPYALHFMDAPSSIAFGAGETFGTCQESRNTYNNQAPANDFMGPSLWPSDFDIYAHSNPEAVAFVGGDLGSHLDMLHESPLCMGIAWERDNIYWTFDGLSSSISRYDFMQDHGPGYDDHSDGQIWRYATGEVARVEGVPSHLEYDAGSGLLYIADTGNSRIAVMDTATGRSRGRLEVFEPGTQLWRMEGADIRTLIDSDAGELGLPTGLALHGGLLYVSDHETGRISAFELDGTLVDYLDTGLGEGHLMGLAFDGDLLYFLDGPGNQLFRLSAK